MAIRINFDASHNPESPTIVLARKNGDIIGKLDAKAIEVSDVLKDASEISFNVNKFVDNEETKYWDEIVDFKLVHCVEWDMWFEITVTLDEATETVKTVFCRNLGHAELSQIELYNIEINTENDIARDDYEIPTVLYNIERPEASLLHRIMEKAQHYTIIHVDETIAKIQRTFSFDDISIYDAFQEIADEINCLFVFHSNSDKNGKIQRTISVYDLETNCNQCGYRGEYADICPECGSLDISEGYGEDTTIFITADELADDIQLSNDTDSIKNCFKLEAGDDLMTATVRNCNPNGTDYIWYVSDALKADMSQDLVDKIESYNELYSMYQKDYVVDLDETLLDRYNNLVDKYKVYNEDLENITIPIVGYPALMNAYYNTIDLEMYLKSSLMPSVEMIDTDAIKEAAKLTVENLSPVSVNSIANISLATADNAVLAMAKIVADSKYRIKVATSTLERGESYQIWTGNFTVTNYYDEEDKATSEIISIIIDDNYSAFVQQKMEKALNKDNEDDLSISGLFAKTHNEFVDELKKYSLNYLKSFYNSCQSCIDILIEQGIADKDTWSGQEPNLYDDLYVPYLNKLSAIEAETKIRQDEVDLIVGVYDIDNELKTYGLQNYIVDIVNLIQGNLNFEKYLGSDLWLEFCSFRREDKYSNDNYISDGLNNAELFKRAYEFIKTAKKDIYKSAELQHSISTTLKNLLVIKKFEPLVDYFKVGNWFRIEVDNEIYKLRLIKYTINYDDIDNISVEFSDVVKQNQPMDIIKRTLNQASSMATTYDSVQRQAYQGAKSNSIVNNWINTGLDATTTKIIGGADNQTQTWDEHGMLFKKYDAINDSYDNIQLKIINSTIAITDDNWQTVKTAVGAYYYFHPETGKLTRAYGVNAETIIGKIILGENMTMQNKSGTMVFDDDGLTITSGSDDDIGTMTFNEDGLVVKHGKNTVTISPKSEEVMNITNGEESVFVVDENGELSINGNIIARSLKLENGVTIDSGVITNLSNVAVSGSYDDLVDTPNFAQVAFTGDYNDLTNTPNFAQVAISGSYNDLIDTPILSKVATSGDYNDLINTPDLSGIAKNTKSIEDILVQIEALNKAVFNEV